MQLRRGLPLRNKGIMRFAVVGLILLLLLAYRSWKVSPAQVHGEILRTVHLAEGTEPIRDQVVHALRRGSGEALCRLADPSELEQLRLTPAAVTDLLREGPPLDAPGIRFDRFRPVGRDKVDIRQWIVDCRSPTSNESGFAIMLMDTPDRGWKLNLSDLLKAVCNWRYGRRDSLAHYIKWARKHDVDGILLISGEKTSRAHYEAVLARRRAGAEAPH
jgi:hypothetical protein